MDGMKSLKSGIFCCQKLYISLPFHINFSYQCQNKIAFVYSILRTIYVICKLHAKAHINKKIRFSAFLFVIEGGKTKTEHIYFLCLSLIPLCGLNFHVSICVRLKSSRNSYLPNKLTQCTQTSKIILFVYFVNRRLKFWHNWYQVNWNIQIGFVNLIYR